MATPRSETTFLRTSLADADASSEIQFADVLTGYANAVEGLKQLFVVGDNFASASSAAEAAVIEHAMLPPAKIDHLAWSGAHYATKSFVAWCQQNVPAVSVPELLHRLGVNDRGNVRLSEFFVSLETDVNLCLLWMRIAPSATSSRGAQSQSTQSIVPQSAPISSIIVFLRQPESLKLREALEQVSGAAC